LSARTSGKRFTSPIKLASRGEVLSLLQARASGSGRFKAKSGKKKPKARMNLDDLVSKRIALRDVNEGYAALKDGSLNRVVVTSF
jgi:Zn-dependent alcohol dehydrogenase